MSVTSLQDCLGFKQIMRAGANIIRDFQPTAAIGEVASAFVRQINSVIHCVALSDDTISNEPEYETFQLDNGNYVIRKLRPDFFGILYTEEFDEDNPPYTVLPGEYASEADAEAIIATLPLIYISAKYYYSTDSQPTSLMNPQPPLSIEMATDLLIDVNHIIRLSPSAQHLADLIIIEPDIDDYFFVIDAYIERAMPGDDNSTNILTDFFTDDTPQRRTIHGLFSDSRLADGKILSYLEMDGTQSNNRFRYAMTLIHELQHASQTQTRGFTLSESYRGLPLQLYNLMNFEAEFQANMMEAKAALELNEADSRLRPAVTKFFLNDAVAQHLAIALRTTNASEKAERFHAARQTLLSVYQKENDPPNSPYIHPSVQQWLDRPADPTKSPLDSKANLLTTLNDWNNAGAGL